MDELKDACEGIGFNTDIKKADVLGIIKFRERLKVKMHIGSNKPEGFISAEVSWEKEKNYIDKDGIFKN